MQCLVRSANDKAFQVLKAAGLKVERKDGDVLCHVDDKSTLRIVMDALQDPDVYYDEIMVRRSSLEDVFLKLTGKRIEEHEEVKA
jgi:hypothetical protein